MKQQDNMLPNLKSQSDTDLRRTCHENGNGVYTSLLVALPGVLSSRHKLKDKCSAPEMKSRPETACHLAGWCRTRTEIDYNENSSQEPQRSDNSSFSCTDLEILKRRCHTETLTARLAIEFLGII